MSNNFFKDNDDLQYYFERGIDWEELVELNEFGFRTPDGFDNAGEAVEFYRNIAEMVGEFVATEVAPHAAEVDSVGVRLEHGEAVVADKQDEIFEHIKALELHGMCLPRELGGMNCPLLLYMINTELFARADVSMMAHHGFHGGIAMAMLVFSVMEGSTEIDPETATIKSTRFAEEIEEIRRGDAWGCMDITEPDAGSDMARLKAVGEQDEDGNWFVTGNKIFITSGHGKYHFVIARTEKVDGSKTIRLSGAEGPVDVFLVPTYSRQTRTGTRTRIVELDRLEEKMGHHGSVTASAGVRPGAGASHRKARRRVFKYMLTHDEQRAVGGWLRVDRPVRGSVSPGARLCRGTAEHGKDDRQARDDRRLPR